MASSRDPSPLAGRTVVVTGASSGIGRAVARCFADAGARVVMVARGEAALRDAAMELNAVALPADITDADAVDRLAKQVRDETGGAGPDVVVNAAGAFGLAAIVETTTESFDRQLAVNLRGAFLVVRAFLPAMLARRSGHVVTLGSIAGRVPMPANGAYAASKFGVRGLHAVMDLELRGSGVRSTLVEAAATDTPLWAAVDRTLHVDLPARDSMMTAAAVADAVLYAVTRPPEVDVRTISLERA